MLLNRIHPWSVSPAFSNCTAKMNTLSKNRSPLFVNSSQVQKYGCSPRVSTAVVSDDGADQWNIFSRFSTSSSMDAAAKRVCKDFSNDDKSHYKPNVSNAPSPIFNRQKQPKSLPSSQNSQTVDDSVRTIRKDSVVTPRMPVDNSSDSSSTSKAEDSDCASAVLPVHSRKRRCRRVYQLIDSDSSDSDVQICKTSFSNDSINKKSKRNGVTTDKSIQRLSALEHRHCFDPLLNCDSSDAVKNSDIMQSLQRSRNERLRRNSVFRNSVRSCSLSSCETFDGTVAEKSDTADDVTIPSVSSKCSIHLKKLQICDVPCRLVMSQEDKLVLSGRCSSACSCQTSIVNNNNDLSASGDLIRLCEAGAVQSSDMHYCFSDDLFSDNEQVESVCLSPSHYCNSGEYKDDISKASDKCLESAVTCEQPEVPFVSYSQAEDDCILIDDSDDDLFANLTQKDMTIKVEDDEVHQSDDDNACDSGGDDNWMTDDVDYVAAAGSRSPVGEMPETLEVEACDPWIDDVADVSSDELEEAYNAAMNHVVPAEGRNSVSPDGRQLCRDNDNVTVISDADLKLLKQSTNSTCSVLLKPLRMSDFPQEKHFPQKQKCSYESDVVVVDEESDDCHFGISESLRTRSTCEVNTDTKYGVGDAASATEMDIYKKPDTVLKSSDLVRYVRCDELASSETSIRHVKEPDFDAEVVGDRDQTKSIVFKDTSKLSSPCDAGEVLENVDIKYRHDKRRKRAHLALENCVEVAEFYGTTVTKTSKEYRGQKRKLTAVNNMIDVDKVADTKNRNSTGLFSSERDKSHSTTAQLQIKPQKFDKVKPLDNSAYEEEEWKNKAMLQGIGKKTSSLQYHKIAQMRVCDKQKLRKDKKHTRQQQVDDSMGLSQFSVAKQQLVERNRLLQANGLYYVIFLFHFKIYVKFTPLKVYW